jgi:TPR repeat protein
MNKQAKRLPAINLPRGNFHYNEGVAPDYINDVNWYRKAAEQGNANAQCKLGIMYAKGEGIGKDEKKAVEWYWKSAEQGNADAQYNLGFMYSKGRGIGKNDKKAVAWYKKSAEQGDAKAKRALARLLQSKPGK